MQNGSHRARVPFFGLHWKAILGLCSKPKAAAIEPEFAEHVEAIERIRGNGADRRHQAEPDRQVVMAALGFFLSDKLF
jgi:hypothetical protein